MFHSRISTRTPSPCIGGVPRPLTEKTPIGAQGGPAPVSGGPVRRHIAEKKIEEAEQKLAATRGLTAMYLPLNPTVLRQALQTRRVDLEHEPAGGNALVINDYVKPGDRLTLELDTATLQPRRITVKSYFSSPADVFTANIQFSVLEDGTTYPSVTTIDAPGKELSITTVSSNFSRPGSMPTAR